MSYFLFSIINRRAEIPFIGKLTGANVAPATENKTDTCANNGYKVSEIDNEEMIAYYGFTNHDGAWYITKEDTDSGSFRYCKGESNFPNSWTNRVRLNYDYYSKVFS